MEPESLSQRGSTRVLALAHLTLLGMAPPQVAEVAADAGFTHIGVRVVPATDREVHYDLSPGSSLLRATRKSLNDTGIEVLDIEALNLNGATSPEIWLPALESGAVLGATVLNVIGSDPDHGRLADVFAALAADSQAFGIRASLEPSSFQPLSSLAIAGRIVEGTDTGGVMLDTLHFQRAGGELQEIGSVPPQRYTVVQLCDGPTSVPLNIEVPEYSPVACAPDATPRSIEARVHRQLPGDGAFPLTSILNRLPAGVPISVEVPNPVLIHSIGAAAYAHRAYRAATALVGQTLPPCGRQPTESIRRNGAATLTTTHDATPPTTAADRGRIHTRRP